MKLVAPVQILSNDVCWRHRAAEALSELKLNAPLRMRNLSVLDGYDALAYAAVVILDLRDEGSFSAVDSIRAQTIAPLIAVLSDLTVSVAERDWGQVSFVRDGAWGDLREQLSQAASKTPLARQELGSLEIDRHRRTVRVRGEPCALTSREFHILAALSQYPGRQLSFEQLGSRETVRFHISNLRAKLGSSAHMIRTARGAGYCIGGGSESAKCLATSASSEVSLVTGLELFDELSKSPSRDMSIVLFDRLLEFRRSFAVRLVVSARRALNKDVASQLEANLKALESSASEPSQWILRDCECCISLAQATGKKDLILLCEVGAFLWRTSPLSASMAKHAIPEAAAVYRHILDLMLSAAEESVVERETRVLLEKMDSDTLRRLHQN